MTAAEPPRRPARYCPHHNTDEDYGLPRPNGAVPIYRICTDCDHNLGIIGWTRCD